MPSTTRTVASALVGAATVAAHGYVSNVVINGVSYGGYDVTKFPYQENPEANVLGWATTATDLGFVEPKDFGGPDIICHLNGENAPAYVEIAAGDSAYIQWNEWPDSHSGPIIDYLASCGDVGCDEVDKTDLEFFKIAEKGLINADGIDFGKPARFATDELLENGVGWMVKIPDSIAPGNYVLRHEIIALHSGNEDNGAQAYPQCLNLLITGSGSDKPQGVKGTALYSRSDKGILYDLYNKQTTYPIPGPKLISGASAIEQASSAIDSTGTATLGSGTAPTGTNPGDGDESSSSEAAGPTPPPSNDLPEQGTPTPYPTPTPSPSSISSVPSGTIPSSTAQAEPTENPQYPAPHKPRPGKGKGKGKDTCKLKKRSSKLARMAEAY